jgi:ferredoxin
MRRSRPNSPEAPNATTGAVVGRAAGQLRILVDLNRCQAYAQCCFLAPEVFELHGEEALWYDPAPDASRLQQVRRAAASCPVQAITVEPALRAVGRPSAEPQGETP